MEEAYRWDETTYTALAAAGVPWQDAAHVLHHARPRVRHHTGAVLRIAAPAVLGHWLVVALIEEGDDTYLVVGARWLDDTEAASLAKLVEGG